MSSSSSSSEDGEVVVLATTTITVHPLLGLRARGWALPQLSWA